MLSTITASVQRGNYSFVQFMIILKVVMKRLFIQEAYKERVTPGY